MYYDSRFRAICDTFLPSVTQTLDAIVTKMSYQLLYTENEYVENISQIMNNYLNEAKDVCLISIEGHRVYTHKILLVMYSPLLRSIVTDFQHLSDAAISIPVSFNSLLKLVAFLSVGKITTEMNFENGDILKEIVEVAGLAGIDLKNVVPPLSRVATTKSKKVEPAMFEFKEEGECVDLMIKNESTDHTEGIEHIEEVDHTEETDHTESKDQQIGVTIHNGKDHVWPNIVRKVRLKNRKPRPNQNLPIKCPECDKIFKDKGNFNRHFMSHSGLKNFSCTECDKRFSRSDKLNEHIKRNHPNNENLLVCHHCKKAFMRKEQLKKHIDAIHESPE